MKHLDEIIKKVLKKETKKRKNTNILKQIEMFNQLEKKGLIKKDSYSVRRIDTIGYSNYGVFV